MNSLYLSTGRKPSQLTRRLAKLLSFLLKAKYENRGKRSVDDICLRAEKHGCQKIAFIYEKKGNPSAVQFYDEKEGWLKEEIMIFGINMPEREGRIPNKVKMTGMDEQGKKMMELLGLEQEIEDENSKMKGEFSSSRITFTKEGEKVLEMKCKLIEKGKSE